MNGFTLTAACLCIALAGCATQSMSIHVKTSAAGETAEIALMGSGKATVNWGDQSAPDTLTLREMPFNMAETHETGNWKIPHTYTSAGDKTVTVTGHITGIFAIMPKAAANGENAATVEKLRNWAADVAKIDSNFEPVATKNEALIYNGHSCPIIGYAREGSRGHTIVIIPTEYTHLFTEWDGGVLSKTISGTATVNSGKYSGKWNAWYLYTDDAWKVYPHTNIYIDAIWGTR